MFNSNAPIILAEKAYQEQLLVEEITNSSLIMDKSYPRYSKFIAYFIIYQPSTLSLGRRSR